MAYYKLALLHRNNGAYSDAVGVLRRGLAVAPDFVPINQTLAWILAVTPVDSVRDGPEAVRIAEHACELTHQKDARCLDALAAAYAEHGRFDEAVTTAGKAIRLAATAGRTDQAAEISDRRQLYESRRPFRERGR